MEPEEYHHDHLVEYPSDTSSITHHPWTPRTILPLKLFVCVSTTRFHSHRRYFIPELKACRLGIGISLSETSPILQASNLPVCVEAKRRARALTLSRWYFLFDSHGEARI